MASKTFSNRNQKSKKTIIKANKNLKKGYAFNYSKIIRYSTKLKNEYRVTRNIKVFDFLKLFLFIILLNPIFSSNIISLDISNTNENYVPILNANNVGRPKFIYLNNDIANSSLISYSGEKLHFKCEEGICQIKLEWEEESSD